jgi:hypothetical protein
MFDGNWSLRDAVGDWLYTAILLVIIPSFISGFIASAILCGNCKERFKQEALEHGAASYKVDNKGNVTFEWNK